MATRQIPVVPSAPKRAPNIAKWHSYTEAWRRIKLANEGGFYFETVTICESIISDRLLSYLNGAQGKKFDTKTGFVTLVNAWSKSIQVAPDTGSASNKQSADLCNRVNEWRVARNHVVHGLAKSMPGTATKDLHEFLTQTKNTAETGTALARLVSKWHRESIK